MMLAHFQSGPLPHLVAPTTPTINTASTTEMPGYGYSMIDQQQHQNMHNYHNNNTTFIQQQYVAPQPAPCSRKRKADSQPENNERLSKRMSLLNLGMFHHHRSPPLYHISDIMFTTLTALFNH